MAINLWLLLLLASTICFVYGDDKHFVCKQVDEIFSGGNPPSSQPTSIPLQGRTGKCGSTGEKGDPGILGPPGPPAVVNYTKIQDAVLEEVEALRNEVMSLKRLLVDCDVRYNEKCFHAILHDRNDVNFNAARHMCEEIGWKIANIYDADHYTMIENYLRGKIPSTRAYNTAWLGMTINPQSNEMRYSFGGSASDNGMKWFPGHPISTSSLTNIGIVINRDPASGNGIHDFPPTSTRLGPICEI